MNLLRLPAAIVIVTLTTSCGAATPTAPNLPSSLRRPASAVQPTYLALPLEAATPAPPLPATVVLGSLTPMTSDLRRVSLIHNLHSVEFYRNVLHVGAGTLSRFHSRPLTQFTGSSNQQVGFTISNGYDDVYANLSAYTNVGSVTLGAPSDSCAGSPGMGCINNIATNLHGGCNENGVPCGDNGTGNCLETGTDFYQMYGQTYTTSIFWVGDFCNVTSQDPQESFPVQDVMDGNFQSAYIRNFGDGIPRITVELEQPISDPNLADWYAFIYNY